MIIIYIKKYILLIVFKGRKKTKLVITLGLLFYSLKFLIPRLLKFSFLSGLILINIKSYEKFIKNINIPSTILLSMV